METIKIPNSWAEITTSQFLELQEVDPSMYTSDFSLQLERLAIITNTGAEDNIWEEMDVMEIAKRMRAISFINYSPPTKLKHTLSNGMVFKSFNDITLGEYLDMEYYVNDGALKNFRKVLAIAYRNTKIGEWGEIILEPYHVIDIEKRQYEFDELSITDVFGVLEEYRRFKDMFMQNYGPLFEIPHEDEGDDKFIKIIKDEETIKEIEDAKKEYSSQSKWAWERLLFKMAEGDLTKIQELTHLRLIYVFNFLSMQKELGII